ncbi:MAG: DUF4272 domain-containing protein [Fimbriimonadaceae bacterium]|nr:DUF4272 domain-containing protein [Chthonomonadaceae bacterium]MCO5296579.1 DUF4272 domain-containing protein [Fimbriimonadaceae bacterium]
MSSLDPSEKRRLLSEALMAEEGIAFRSALPGIESEEETSLRAAEEVGARIVCLFCVAGAAEDVRNTFWREYLEEHELWEHLTPQETSLLARAEPDERANIDASWRSEALFVLMWAAGLFEELPIPREQVDSGIIVGRFPPPDASPWPFVQGLTLRSKTEILDAADLIYRLHWEVRHAARHGKKPPGGLDPGVVQERHHALNWLIRYGEQEWDVVSTDT